MHTFSDAARQISAFWTRLLEIMGPTFFAGAGAVRFELTGQGRPMVHVGRTRFFAAESGEVVASRVEGGRVLFATVAEDGLIEWNAAPAGHPELN